jgi:hypothetical protein
MLVVWRMNGPATQQAKAVTTEPPNYRPTATWKLWAVGIVGGAVLSVAVFVAGGGALEAHIFTRVAQVAFALLVLIAGWIAFMRRRQ